MSNKHIAFITNGGFGTGAFSQGIPILNSFIENMALSHSVTIFSLHPTNKGFYPKGYNLIGPKQQLTFLMNFFWLLRTFFRENRKKKINLIHALWGFPPGLFGVVLKKIFHIPVIIHLQGGDAVSLQEINYGIFSNSTKRWLINWAYKNTNELIVLTNYQKGKLREHFSKKIPRVIPFGVDESIFKANSSSTLLRTPFKFIHIAHINRVKDQLTLLDAFKIISDHLDAELKIFGTDTLNGEIQSYASKIGIKDKVCFCGIVPNKDLVEHLTEAHVLLHTSLYEGQAISVSEAIAAGIVVCGTDVGIIADLSVICTISSPVRDAPSLATNVLKLINNPVYYQELVQKGLSWSKEHTMTRTIRQFEQIYEEY